MREIDKILLQIEKHIRSGTYSPIETDTFELKDLSTGENWGQLYESACAFLNTRGGILILGVKEDTKKKKFIFTGFDSNNEPKLKEIVKQFKNDEGGAFDASGNIKTGLIELRSLDLGEGRMGQVCVVPIEKLPENEKYVFFNGCAYERIMTGDHKIKILDEKIQKQKELKEELIHATELELVPSATLDDLDVGLLNEFIVRLNADRKVETLKPDLTTAIPFLTKKRMIRDDNPTLLGMLVCGKNIFDYVGGKCELDAYFEAGNHLAEDRKLLKDNIIPLMEDGWRFVQRNTGTGISVVDSGSAVYEYPKEIIREAINNALAHRDYTSSRFSILRIFNNKYIEISNPGKFRQEQMLIADKPIKLRRIIPIPKAQNQNLADILKVYKRWEGRGIGMASLTNAALNNVIDVPYYRLYNGGDIGLFIPKGKVMDEQCASWLNHFNGYISGKTQGKGLTVEQKTVLAYFYKSALLNDVEKFTINLTPDNNHFETIRDLEEWGLVQKLDQSTASLQVYSIDPVMKRNDFTGSVLP